MRETFTVSFTALARSPAEFPKPPYRSFFPPAPPGPGEALFHTFTNTLFRSVSTFLP